MAKVVAPDPYHLGSCLLLVATTAFLAFLAAAAFLAFLAMAAPYLVASSLTHSSA